MTHPLNQIRSFSLLTFKEKSFGAGDKVDIQIMRVEKW